MLVRENGMQEIEKLSSYHSLRFCSRLQAELPAGWRLRFKRGSRGNLNIHLFPKWTCKSLAGSGNGFLFQLTPTGGNIRVIWINASEAVLKREPEGSCLWHFQRIKAKMKNRLGPNPKIYRPDMVERLLDVVAEARQLVEQAALV
ncbi:hypothetical protein SAMN02746041_02467 [Desulfacinum hydrothermale DSM 13146]|uniref:Uncharacterized protein n=1 Tax=Desulfacinum hydrothermale DSM 13146 TaxID=1121390 RepID=A0A1W1XPZ7_9BACT|nr:hypothetical protein [Desulfacinum hydrothermale]SMC25944.1 hypothetical protein SAMN02746041_02467 [Desulfacinum hydrothermale DSM 13146]